MSQEIKWTALSKRLEGLRHESHGMDGVFSHRRSDNKISWVLGPTVEQVREVLPKGGEWSKVILERELIYRNGDYLYPQNDPVLSWMLYRGIHTISCIYYSIKNKKEYISVTENLTELLDINFPLREFTIHEFEYGEIAHDHTHYDKGILASDFISWVEKNEMPKWTLGEYVLKDGKVVDLSDPQEAAMHKAEIEEFIKKEKKRIARNRVKTEAHKRSARFKAGILTFKEVNKLLSLSTEEDRRKYIEKLINTEAADTILGLES